MAAQPDLTHAGNPRLPGQFKKGNDPRRMTAIKVLPDGRTLAQLCRSHAPEAIEAVVAVMRGKDPESGEDKDWPIAARLRAAELLLERGFGKAPAVVQVESQELDLSKLGREALQRIVAAADAEEAQVVPEGPEAAQGGSETS